MPSDYFVDLPMITCRYNNMERQLPRAYLIAAELLSISSGVVEMETVERFIVELQQISALRMGELWALPIFLKISLIANIARATERVLQHIQLIHEANEWCEALITMQRPHGQDQFDSSSSSESDDEGEQNQLARQDSIEDLNRDMYTMISQIPTLQSTFLMRVVANLRAARIGPTPLRILDQMLAKEGIDLESVGRQENARVAVNNVLMQHSISSLRSVGSLDWKKFFEANSLTELTLRQDPKYAEMTFSTRDSYRHSVERVASRIALSEEQVAQIAVELARQAPEGRESHVNHVGYFLIDDGVESLERVCQYTPTILERLSRATKAHIATIYFSGTFLFAVLLFLFFFILLPGLPIWAYIVLAVFSHELSIEVVHQCVTNLYRPSALPRLDYTGQGKETGGIPNDCKTAVVVPIMFCKPSDVYESVRQLEIQFLANRDRNVNYILLSDFADSDEAASLPEDKAIIDAIVDAVNGLNDSYPEQCFYIFHRPRLHNPTQGVKGKGVYMGWERKRGKLMQLNTFFVKGNSEETREPFSLIHGGSLDRLDNTRYVLCLDADTLLPLEGVRLLVGTAAHPLNRPVVDPVKRVVTRGYGIFQPRLATHLRRTCTRFAWIFSASPGIDPYVTAVSDVYQDLFGEGSFVGKGIYDVHAIEKCLSGRFLDNRILSHDLLESSYTRSALVTDIEMYDDFPGKFNAYVKRKHRWVRGDWQLIRWVVGPTLSPKSTAERIGTISSLARWKLFDNMRRSIVEIFKFIWFLGVILFVPPHLVLPCILLALFLFFFPWLLSVSWSLARPPRGNASVKRNYYKIVFADFHKSAQQALVMFATLPHEAFTTGDAILLTLGRMVTKRNLLEWTPFSLVEASSSVSARSIYRQFIPSTVLSLCLVPLAVIKLIEYDYSTSALIGYALCALTGAWWVAAPYIVSRLSLTTVDDAGERIEPDPVEEVKQGRKGGLSSNPANSTSASFCVDEARRYALLHWRFFDEFMNESTHYLPPDNVQEIPTQKVAMRTSPTNIAMGIMAVVSAVDLGFIGPLEAIRRLEKTFKTLDGLQRFRGHFYNWYSLEPLKTLHPLYISTVDSGNFVAGLISVSMALKEWKAKKMSNIQSQQTIFDAASSALRNVLRLCGPPTPTSSVSGKYTPSNPSGKKSPFTPYDRSISALQSALHALEGKNPNVNKIRGALGQVRDGLGIAETPRTPTKPHIG